MKKIIYIFLLSINILFANSLDNLLHEYEDSVQDSLQTVDEKFGHVIIYSQKEIKLMQYNKLSDILKELPLLNLNRNNLGNLTPSLPGTQTPVNGFFRLFINDTEVSSLYTKSFSQSWIEMPLDFVDHIEVYYGESSFSQSNETGVFFIRVYTKSAQKENGSQYATVYSNKNSFSQSLTHADSFENGWSYLFFLNQSKSNDINTYNDNTLTNSMKKRYFYLDINNDTSKINIAYNDIQKDLFLGTSYNSDTENGNIKSKDYFIDMRKSFLYDNSLEMGVSYTVSERTYQEIDEDGLWITPVINFTQNPANTIPTEISTNIKINKKLLYVSKEFDFNHNQISASFNIQTKQYKTIDNENVNFFGQKTEFKQYSDFNKETISSLIFSDTYTLYDNMILIGNLKFDKYNRHGYFENTNEEMYRIGTIYTPFKNFGLKSFYTKTHLPPSFYTADYASFRNTNIKTQKYKFFTYEAVYTTEKAKYGIRYNNVKIDNFIYQTVIGFENINRQIKNKGIVFYYKYQFSKKSEFSFNYYTTDSSEKINNSDKGANVKYTGNYGKIEYFTSLIYKNKYSYKPNDSNHISVKDSYMLNVGVTYNYSKNLSLSIKGENILDKSTKSLYTNYSTSENYSLNDFDRVVSMSLKWKF